MQRVFRKAFNAAFDAMIERYKKGVLFFIKCKWMVWTLLAASVVLLAFLMNTTKTSLVPDEDQGVVFVNVSTAAGSSLKTTNDVMMRIEKRMMDIPQVLHVQRVAGYGLLAGQGNSIRYADSEAGNLGMNVKERRMMCKRSSGKYMVGTADIKMPVYLPFLRV